MNLPPFYGQFMGDASEDSFFAPVEEDTKNPFSELQDETLEEEQEEDQIAEEDEDDGDDDGEFEEGYDIYEQSDFDGYFRYL